VSEDGRITRACHNDLQVLTGEIGDNKDNDRKIICELLYFGSLDPAVENVKYCN
jgi:hypothetical protein